MESPGGGITIPISQSTRKAQVLMGGRFGCDRVKVRRTDSWGATSALMIGSNSLRWGIDSSSSPPSASDGPSGEAAGMEANKRRLTLDLASTLQRWLKVWRSRASACAEAVKPPSAGRPTAGEADTPLPGSPMRHSQHAPGAPPRRYGRYAVRPRLRAGGFSRMADRCSSRRRYSVPLATLLVCTRSTG